MSTSDEVATRDDPGTHEDVGEYDEVPDITVELTDRRPVFLESTLGGALAGGLVLVAARLDLFAASAVGVPTVLGPSTPLVPVFFHLVFATVLGSLFGLLSDTRPFWMYGRGFLGPVVGAIFGMVLWAVVAVGFWPLALDALAIPLGFGDPPAAAAAFGTYLAYGTLTGSLMNLVGLLRA